LLGWSYFLSQAEIYRESCHHCFRTKALCLCDSIEPFQIEPLMVLLVHPREFMKTIGTVRMVKLSITGSLMLRGHGKEFDSDARVLSLIENSNHHCVILFPGEESLNLTSATDEKIKSELPANKRLVIFVIDGTWSAAKNMIRDSKRLSALPKISFDANITSVYEIRKQPKSYCLSTIEAVSVLIENLKNKNLCTPQPTDGHLKMIEGFKKLISSQLDFESRPEHRHAKWYRRGKPKHLKEETIS
jgi:DTW domain-containing protein YfiP